MFVKAIETEYKGVTFRSRVEARWAVFFDALSIPWEYEKATYWFEGERYQGGYKPDFWIGHGYWIEIKGFLDTIAVAKARLLANQTGCPVYVFDGTFDKSAKAIRFNSNRTERVSALYKEWAWFDTGRKLEFRQFFHKERIPRTTRLREAYQLALHYAFNEQYRTIHTVTESGSSETTLRRCNHCGEFFSRIDFKYCFACKDVALELDSVLDLSYT
jgi:hypothetical protein